MLRIRRLRLIIIKRLRIKTKLNLIIKKRMKIIT